MSKATFYEHFDNKEECILELTAAAGAASRAAVAAAVAGVEQRFEAKVHARVHAFLSGLAAFPEMARVVMVDVIGVGPRGAAQRDDMLRSFADFLVAENHAAHEAYGAPVFASPHDAYAIVGAIVELASHQLRTGDPADIRELEPVIERMVAGVLQQGAR
jgi:AcrR family transcriptional regulator